MPGLDGCLIHQMIDSGFAPRMTGTPIRNRSSTLERMAGNHALAEERLPSAGPSA